MSSEAVLFMQMYTTPREKIMRSIELITEKMMHKLNPQPEAMLR